MALKIRIWGAVFRGLCILDARAKKGSLIIASQRPFREWYEYLGSNYYADAIIDRLKNTSYRIELKGHSLRESTQEAQMVNKRKSKKNLTT